jgi:hypothetical protein
MARLKLGRSRSRQGLTSFLDRYLEQLKYAKIKGYLFQQQNYYENREG